MDNAVMTKNFSPVQNRLIRVVKAMAGHEAKGLAPSAIAKRADISATEFTKTIDNLVHEGWAEKHPADDGRYRLTAQFAQMANTIALELRNAMQQLQQDEHNYGRLA